MVLIWTWFSQYWKKMLTNISSKLWFLWNVRISLQKCPRTRFPGSQLIACLQNPWMTSWPSTSSMHTIQRFRLLPISSENPLQNRSHPSMLNKLKSIKDIETMRFKNILYRKFYVHIETKLLLMSTYKRIFNDFTMVSYMYRKFMST